MNYSHLLGSLLSSQTPYLFMLSSGYFFAYIELIGKEAVISFSRLNVDIFLPTYLFILVCKSTFTYNFEQYWIIILSFIFYFAISGVLAFLWTLFSKIDLRYRYTFIMLTCFVDIKRLHYLYINSFCFHLENKTEKEKIFCDDIIVNSDLHAFFQGILIWYMGFNLIRIDKAYQKQVINLWEKIKDSSEKKEEENKEVEMIALNKNNDNLHQDLAQMETDNKNAPLNSDANLNENNPILDKKQTHNNGEKEIILTIFNEYKIKDTQGKFFEIYANSSFYNKISPYQQFAFSSYDKKWKEILYILFQSPLIALFTGFVVGFIRVIRVWIFDTTTPVYLFYDTFNNIGNCNILLGFLIAGASLRVKETISSNTKPKIRFIDYIMHFTIKVLIMPYLGIIFSYILHKNYYSDNKVLNWACYIQWLLPTSLDILNMICVIDINIQFAGICLVGQYIFQAIINNLINVPPFLKALKILD